MRLALLAVVGLVLVAPACAAPRTDSSASTDLTIRYWPEGRAAGSAQTWTLRCGPPGGSLPQRASACARLAKLDRPFAPIPKDTVCTELYGGPQEAVVSGRFDGRRIWVLLRRRNGCEIGRFEGLRFLVPDFRGGNA